jgi:hypothetical protein
MTGNGIDIIIIADHSFIAAMPPLPSFGVPKLKEGEYYQNCNKITKNLK